LAVAEIDDQDQVRYDPEKDHVRQKVAKANRIALFIHGIVGDTRVMASSLKRAGLDKSYDLVLTFDYERLNDPISDTANPLKERLVDVGLGLGHGKSLDLIAHSMGGLVSRWFVEREGGNKQVSRLVLLGTPSGGSPWPPVAEWASNALALGLNGLTQAAWPA